MRRPARVARLACVLAFGVLLAFPINPVGADGGAH